MSSSYIQFYKLHTISKQVIPNEQPASCKKNFEKQDLNAFKSDFKKWQEWISEEAFV